MTAELMRILLAWRNTVWDKILVYYAAGTRNTFHLIWIHTERRRVGGDEPTYDMLTGRVPSSKDD